MTPDASELAGAWIDEPRFAPLFAELLAAVTKQYRVDEAAADQLLRESLSCSQLAAVVEKSTSPADIRRTRIYKDASAAAKGHVYHALRRYRADGEKQAALIARLREGGRSLSPADVAETVEQLLAGHVSTRERQADAEAFYTYLVDAIGSATSLLDIGCGIQPLMFPFKSLPNLCRYFAVDSNQQSIDAVAAFALATGNMALRAMHDNLSGGWQAILAAAGQDEFDVALMLKLIPVVARQSRELIGTLAQTPARRWIVTGSTTGLAKRTSILRREQTVLRRFISDSGRTIREEFKFGEEFGYVVEC
jgi:hypothetical protein